MNEPVIRYVELEDNVLEILVALPDNDEQKITIRYSGPAIMSGPNLSGYRLSGVRYDSAAKITTIHALRDAPHERLRSLWCVVRGDVVAARRTTYRDITQMIKRGDHVL